MRRKVAAIVGAYGGMGTAITHKLYEDDYDLALIGRNLQKLEKLKTSFSPVEGRKISTHSVELSQTPLDTQAVSMLFDQYPKLDVLIYTAGIVIPGALIHLDTKDWDHAVQTNLLGMIHMVSLFGKHMVNQGDGRIILINGVLSLQPDPNMLINSTLTGAVNNFAKALSKDIGKQGVRVNVLNPGVTDTPLWDVLYRKLGLEGKQSKMDFLKQIAKSIPLDRIGTANDIANMVSFLCSDNAQYLNGSFLTVDGGACAAY